MRGPIIIGAALLCACSAAAAADQPPICPDRPGKANATCTAPAGHFQLETGLADWTLKRSDGERDTLLVVGATAFKYGLTDRSHIEIDMIPWERATSRAGGVRETASGLGDLLVRYKQQLTPPDAPVQVTVYPYVKLPTARRDLGNGKIEAGVELPVNIPLGNSGFSVAFDPEADLLADADGNGRHPAMVQVMDLNWAPNTRLTFTGEIWGRWDYDPAGTVRQFSADGAVAYLVSNDVQIDAGANFGLNRETPDVELYFGVSRRF